MKRRFRNMFIAILALMLSSGMILLNRSTANAEPGSSTDPLVSKSYVDEKFNQITALLGGSSSSESTGGSSSSVPVGDYDELMSDIMAQITFLYGDKLGETTSDKYTPVSASVGQIISGDEGTEIILRSGAAVAYCPGVNGLVDATDGAEIFNNSAIKTNHILIVPRNDFRGVRVTSDAWFIIKGDYNFLE